LVPSPAAGQKWELQATQVQLIGAVEPGYPLQKKGHSSSSCGRSRICVRGRTLFGAVFRVRSRLAYAVHQFFQERDFVYVHTPIITTSDCEGAGEMFRVTTLKGERGQRPERIFLGAGAI
jgi:asparaginyl-tRNA synthetase